MDLIHTMVKCKSCSCHLVHPDVESFQMLCKSPGGGDGGVYKQTRARLLCVGHLWFCLPFDLMKVWGCLAQGECTDNKYQVSGRRLTRVFVLIMWCLSSSVDIKWDRQSMGPPADNTYDWAVIDVPPNPTLISANPHKTQSTNGVIMSPLWTLLQIDLICQLYCSTTRHWMLFDWAKLIPWSPVRSATGVLRLDLICRVCVFCPFLIVCFVFLLFTNILNLIIWFYFHSHLPSSQIHT